MVASPGPALISSEKATPSVATGLARQWEAQPSRISLREVFLPGMRWLLAWRNLVHDRVRFAVTLVGIAFSVVLMAVQWGLLAGSAQTASALIDHGGADFWVTSRGTSNVDQSLPLPERWRFKALTISGVSAVDPLLVQFAGWRRPDGRSEYVIVVGFDLDSRMGGPWNIVGNIEDLREPDAVMIDRIYAEKLGISAIGQTVEIGGRRARIVGFTNGIRAFTQSPYVFTSYKNAHRFTFYNDDQTTYLLVRAKPGENRYNVEHQLRTALPISDIWPSDRFASRTARYWLLTTGAGAALVVGAALGILVGIVIVAQTLYAATVERLSEYATLLAMGARNSYLNQVILRQALISGVLGYGIGITVAMVVVKAAANSTAPLVLPWQLSILVAAVALSMCCVGSLVAIHKVKRIDPTLVFK